MKLCNKCAAQLALKKFVYYDIKGLGKPLFTHVITCKQELTPEHWNHKMRDLAGGGYPADFGRDFVADCVCWMKKHYFVRS